MFFLHHSDDFHSFLVHHILKYFKIHLTDKTATKAQDELQVQVPTDFEFWNPKSDLEQTLSSSTQIII